MSGPRRINRRKVSRKKGGKWRPKSEPRNGAATDDQRAMRAYRTRVRRAIDPFWQGAETEDDLEKERFLDWLAQSVRNGSSRNLEDAEYRSVFNMAQQGMMLEQIAHSLGMTKRRLKDLAKQDEKLAWALEAGRSKGMEFVTSMLMDRIANGNVSAIMFYLRVQGGWSERRVLELESHTPDGKGDGRIQQLLPYMTDEELEQLNGLLESADERQRREQEHGMIEGKAQRVEDDGE